MGESRRHDLPLAARGREKGEEKPALPSTSLSKDKFLHLLERRKPEKTVNGMETGIDMVPCLLRIGKGKERKRRRGEKKREEAAAGRRERKSRLFLPSKEKMR